MNQEELKQRTKQFGIRTIRLIETLPKNRTANVIANQILRSATSVGANYRSACRGRSKAEFISKVGICIEEADETQYWMEILDETGMVKKELLVDLLKEADEIIAILTATVKTSRKNMKK